MESTETALFSSTMESCTMETTARTWCVNDCFVSLSEVFTNIDLQFNIFIQLGSATAGTKFAAGEDTRETMATYTRGNEWMIFVDDTTRRQLWDYVCIQRIPF